MNFLDIGFSEILLILVVALIVFGPGKMLEIARMMGRAVRTLRKITSDLTTAVTKELNTETDGRQSQSRVNSGDKTKASADAGTTESSSLETPSPRG
jgi:sec-independent protein translocase protein TatA